MGDLQIAKLTPSDTTSPDEQQRKFFKEIWETYYSSLTLFCETFFPKEYRELEDICQEIMLKVFRKLYTYNPRFSFTTWFYTIARNTCIDEIRKKQIEIPADFGSAEFRPETFSSRYPGPEESAIASELERYVDSFLETLPSRDRQIAVLRFSGGLKHREIGKILKLPAGTIRYRVHQIRKNLQLFLSEGYENV
jgi:RNA polymerase sigma-70 factor (ECF subfamily)